MKKYRQIFKEHKTVIGMIHLNALPGSPLNDKNIDQITTIALEELAIYEKSGVHAILIENMHDVPYHNRIVGDEVIAAMSVIASNIAKHCKLPMGIQVLAGANKSALAIALAAGLQFIRAEAFVYGHLADEGWMNADAADLLRYRKFIGAEHIAIFTDIQKKHASHAASSDLRVDEHAKAAEFFLSDGLVLSGRSTGEEVDTQDLKEVKKQSSLPILIGSGVDQENIHRLKDLADAFIIGSHFKKSGHWANAVDADRVIAFMNTFHEIN